MFFKPIWIKRFRAPAICGAFGLAACGGSEPPAKAAQAAPRQIAPAEQGCQAPAYERAAASNSSGLRDLGFSLFGRQEVGWETYAPLLARELRTACGPDSSGFAAAVSRWAPGRSPDGVVDIDTLKSLAVVTQGRRPAIKARATGVCPDPPPEASLAAAGPEEGYQGKHVMLQPGALAAYRRMVTAARAEVPEIGSDGQWLTIFSAYRSPAYDAARCERDGNCDGVRRATCSPHRTGLALDLYVGQADGFGPDSTVDENRRAQSRTAAYRWLVTNAGRFGFTNYAFEPWHWEWDSEAGG